MIYIINIYLKAYFFAAYKRGDEMESRKMGPFLLSGLIVGPILGSGIILLPPMVHQVIGNFAIFAWMIIIGLSFLIASLFGRLSILFPGDSGIANAVEQAFGKYIRHLTANFLILAACLGPVAVLMTASQYLKIWIGNNDIKLEWYALSLMIFCGIVLFRNISSVGKVSLILSTLSALILLAGGVTTILFFRGEMVFTTSFEFKSFGYSVLLLFWTLVGWEIIGNYSLEVKNPIKTIPKAVFYSAIVIAIVCLTVVAAIQWIDPTKIGFNGNSDLKLAVILIPLFGSLSTFLITFVTTALCVSTYLLVVGGVARLIASQATEGALPKMLTFRSKKNVPLIGIITLIIIHILVVILLYFNLLQLEQIVVIANAFFLANILIGVLAAMRLIPDWSIRIISLILVLSFSIILSFSSIWILAVIFLMSLYYLIRQFRQQL